jgi:hypothetical protein
VSEQKVWIGSIGPLLYDDDVPIDDVDGDLPGAMIQGLTTTGQISVETAPSQPNNVIRVEDLLPITNQPYTKATFMFQVAGYTPALNLQATYLQVGDLYTIQFPSITGTSTDAVLRIDNIPTSIQPTSSFYFVSPATNNGTGVIVTAYFNAGSITMQLTPLVSDTWTPTGTKGISPFAVTYIRV